MNRCTKFANGSDLAIDSMFPFCSHGAVSVNRKDETAALLEPEVDEAIAICGRGCAISTGCGGDEDLEVNLAGIIRSGAV
jgi:hypothetical protein